MKKLIIYFILVLLLSISPALAQQSVPIAVETAAPSPVTISRLYTQVNDQVFWSSCLNFTNMTAKPMTAIQFRFTYVDAFDTALTTFRADRVGMFTPGVLIEGPENGQITGGGNVDQKIQNCWNVTRVVGSLSKVNAEVVKVRYSDGTIWVAPDSHPVFTGYYMGGGNGFVDPPQDLACRAIAFGLKTKWSWWEHYAHGNSKLEACVMDWEKEHGNLRGWPPAHVDAQPSPVPSPQ